MKAVKALTWIGAEADLAIPVLVKGATGESSLPPELCFIALGRIGSAALPALIELMGDGYGEAAAAEIAAMGEEAASVVEDLIPMLLSEDFVQAGAARIALAGIGTPAARLLLPLLRSDNPYARYQALSTLRQMGGKVQKEALPALAVCLRDPDAEVREEAAAALADTGARAAGCLPSLLNCLSDAEPLVRVEAARAIARIGKAEALQEAVLVFRELLGDENKDVRIATCDAIAGSGPGMSSLAPDLIRIVDSDVGDLCAAAIVALGVAAADSAEADSAVSAIESRLHQGETYILALGALGEIGAPSVPALLRTLGSVHPSVQIEAARVIGEMGTAGSSASKALSVKLASCDGVTAITVAEALLRVGRDVREEALSVLLEAACDGSGLEAQLAVWSLWRTMPRHASVSRALSPVLSIEHSPRLRLMAALVIWYSGAGCPPEFGALVRRVQDEDWDLVEASVNMFGELPRTAVSVALARRLVALMGDEDWRVRLWAAKALGRLGQSEPEVLHGLEKGHEDADPAVRAAAMAALDLIQER